MIISTVAAYLLVSVTLGFNYLESFRIASALENPQGYRLLAEPLDFIVTRLEGIAEILLFLGPYVLLVALCGLVMTRANGRLAVLALLGIATLGFMFLTGAFRTGETARAAMIVYPFLVIPVGYFFANREDEYRSSSYLLPSLIFGQTLIMQMVGDYFW